MMTQTRPNPVQDIPYKTADGLYQMVVEIPAGTNEKWQTDPETGEFYHDEIDGVPRIINYLPYPMNYGLVPQTLLPKEVGGDGDPLDIITLAPAAPRGTIAPVKVIGALELVEGGEIDSKVIALVPGGPFDGIDDISELLMQHPGTVEIVRLWFEGYKGPGTFLFHGYANKDQAAAMIEEQHRHWQESRR